MPILPPAFSEAKADHRPEHHFLEPARLEKAESTTSILADAEMLSVSGADR